jgi:hypothetical protein
LILNMMLIIPNTPPGTAAEGVHQLGGNKEMQ